MAIAEQAAAQFGRTLSWAASYDGTTRVFTNLSVPVMTRLRITERQVLDTLIESGTARSRSDALAWCVRLVAHHQAGWLTDLRDALLPVKKLREEGPVV